MPGRLPATASPCFGTASAGGSWYPLGGGVANVINKYTGGYSASAHPSGALQLRDPVNAYRSEISTLFVISPRKQVLKGRSPMQVQHVFVVGAGLMGSGIAQVCAQAGLTVTLSDENHDALEKAQQSIAWSVGKLIEKGRLKAEKTTVLDRIATSPSLQSAVAADLAIEAVFEDLTLKKTVFAQLDDVCPSETLLASNTSTLPITELAAATRRPEKVLGLHFFSPVPMMRAVELVRGVRTSDAAMDIGADLIRRLGKEPIRVESDLPGILLNRINLVSYVEAINLLDRGIATAEDIDKGVRLAFGRPMGPFETGDMVGLDVSYNSLKSIYRESGDNRYHPPRLLRRKVAAGHLGIKSGRGWYRYDADGNRR
jgi:3-hydroxybutyryl-CoA dehydrogenase